MSKLLRVLGFALACASWWTWVSPQQAENLHLDEVVANLTKDQHRAGWFRDRCFYYQKVYLERYKARPSEGGGAEPFYRRSSVAEIAADQKGEVVARLLSDTDGDMSPKKVKQGSRNVFGAPAFLELIFFPLYPENLPAYEVMDLGITQSNGRETRMIRLLPRPGFDSKPMVEGVFYVDPKTGAPVRLMVDKLVHFDKLDPKMKKMIEFHLLLDFRTLPNGVSVPFKGSGTGYSEVMRYDGHLKFSFDEWGYRPNPGYPDVVPYFEKMRGFQDPGPADAPLGDTAAPEPGRD